MDSKTSSILRATLFVLLIFISCRAKASSDIKNDDEEKDLRRQLRALNKPPFKSVKMDYGIVDCIDIYKQPALDNPLLINHQIQLWPSNYPMSAREEKQQIKFGESTAYFGGIDCPNGTVPIRRTTKEDLIREKKSSVGLMDYNPFTHNTLNYYAVAKFKNVVGPYGSAEANLAIYNPKSGPDEFSGAQVWLYGGDGPDGNYISAGWTVNPDQYGDVFTHVTAFWKGNGKSGCANVQCPGFVITYKDGPLGGVIRNISSIGGRKYGLKVRIFRDQGTGNWWLAAGPNLIPVGYWPKELIPQLGGGANHFAAGGVVKVNPGVSSPPMGSSMADCNFSNTAYVHGVKYRLNGFASTWLPEWSEAEIQVDCPGVYAVQHNCGEPQQSDDFAFMYGGLGGDCGP